MCVCILNIYLRTSYVPSFVFILAHKNFNEALEKNYNVFEVSSKFIKTYLLIQDRKPLSNYLNSKWKPAQITKSPQGLKCLLS